MPGTRGFPSDLQEYTILIPTSGRARVCTSTYTSHTLHRQNIKFKAILSYIGCASLPQLQDQSLCQGRK